MNTPLLLLVMTAALAFVSPASAEVLAPGSMGISQAFDAVVGKSAFENVSYIARGLTAAISLSFSAWATIGLFQAHFKEGQISNLEWIWLQVRLLAMQSIIIVLISL